MGRKGGRGRNLGNAMSRATSAKKGAVGDQVASKESGVASPERLVYEDQESRLVPARRTRGVPASRSRPGRRNQAGYSARSISILESVYESLDQALADPEQQRRIKAECEAWGVWVPQKKAGKSEVMELLLFRWLEEVNGGGS